MADTIPIHDVMFPTSIASTAKGIYRYKKTRHEGAGGDIQPFGIWERPLSRWVIETIFYFAVTNTDITPADIQLAMDIFHWSSRYKKGFWFQPPSGHIVRAGQGVRSGGEYFVRHEPLAGQIYDRPVVPNPVGLSETSTTWTGKIRVPVIFGTDDIEVEVDGDGNISVLPALEIIEVPNYAVV